MAVRANDATSAARAIHAAAVANCRYGNQARAQQVQLWDHVLVIAPPPPHETPRQRATRLQTDAAFRAYVRRIFAPRDSARVYRLP